jgi:hypothetical protein
MKNKPTMEQAYEAAEKAEYKGMKKSKLSPKQKNIASAAEPKDKINGADFKALKGKKK